jgi:hypothetical protein
MIIENRSATRDLDLNRLNGTRSVMEKPMTLHFAIAVNSFLPILVLNDVLRGPGVRLDGIDPAKRCWLSNARVAFPLDLCNLASDDIHLERAIVANAASLSLERNFVMTGRQRHPKAPLVVRGKRCNLALLVFHHESRVREWL